MSMLRITSEDANCTEPNRLLNFFSSWIQQQQQPFNGLFSRTTWVSQYQKGKSNLDFTGARQSEWQWHQLGHMQVCTSLQTVNHASTPPLCFLQAGCPSCRPNNSVKALKATRDNQIYQNCTCHNNTCLTHHATKKLNSVHVANDKHCCTSSAVAHRPSCVVCSGFDWLTMSLFNDCRLIHTPV